MSYATSDQWGRRTDAEKFRDWNRAKMKRAAGTTQQPKTRRTDHDEEKDDSSSILNLGPRKRNQEDRKAQRQYRKAQIQALRKVYRIEETDNE